MNRHAVVQRVLLAVAMLFLIVLAWQSLSGGIEQISRSRTIGQQFETIVQLACGLLSLLTIVTCFRWHRWGRLIRYAWAISLTLTAGISSLVWGPPMIGVALAFSVIAVLLSLGIFRVLRARLTA